MVNNPEINAQEKMKRKNSQKYYDKPLIISKKRLETFESNISEKTDKTGMEEDNNITKKSNTVNVLLNLQENHSSHRLINCNLVHSRGSSFCESSLPYKDLYKNILVDIDLSSNNQVEGLTNSTLNSNRQIVNSNIENKSDNISNNFHIIRSKNLKADIIQKSHNYISDKNEKNLNYPRPEKKLEYVNNQSFGNKELQELILRTKNLQGKL